MKGVQATPINHPSNLSTGDSISDKAALVTGSYDGQKVTAGQPSIASLIQNAMEELPSNLSERISKKLADRKAKTKSSSRIEELIRKYFKAVSGVNQTERFEKMTQSVKQLSKPTPQQIRDLLDQHFGHEGSLEENFDSAMLLAMEEFFANENHGKEILEAVQEAKSDFGKELQQFYKQEIASFDGINEVYDDLLGKEGDCDFLAATDILISKLGNDLSGSGSKMDSAQLKTTLDSLYHLEIARSTFEAFTQLADKMQKHFGVTLSAG